MSVHIVIPDERAAQLRMIADKRKLPSVADAVGFLINHAFDTGLVARTLPGVVVTRMGTNVQIDFGDFTKSYPRELARAAATGIRYLAKPRSTEMEKALAGLVEEFAGFEHVGISRRGTSIKFTDGAKSRALSPSVALDLAALIDAEAQ